MTPWTVAHQAPVSVVFHKQEYWSRLPFPSPRDLPEPWTKSRFPAGSLLICGQILYQLSHYGSPLSALTVSYFSCQGCWSATQGASDPTPGCPTDPVVEPCSAPTLVHGQLEVGGHQCKHRVHLWIVETEAHPLPLPPHPWWFKAWSLSSPLHLPMHSLMMCLPILSPSLFLSPCFPLLLLEMYTLIKYW